MQTDLLNQIAIRWNDPEPRHAALLREGGITATLGPQVEGIPNLKLPLVPLADIGKTSGSFAISDGLWPGVQRPDPATASATRALWMDQNCGLIQYIRATHPQVAPVLAYEREKDSSIIFQFDSLELALAEAWVSGGNYLMAIDPRYREALLAGKDDALKSWRKLGRTAKWLQENSSLFRQPMLPLITMLVDNDETRELAHLCYRQSVSPALVNSSSIPAPSAACRVLVAVSIEKPSDATKKKILAHAEAGGTVVVDGALGEGLKPVRSDAERNFGALGKGTVVAYKEGVSDPGSFALDLVDIITQKLRPTRIWNMNAALAMATKGPREGTAVVKILNYGRMQDMPVLTRVQGRFTKATLMRPEAGPLEMKILPRGSATEVELPNVEKVAIVLFS